MSNTSRASRGRQFFRSCLILAFSSLCAAQPALAAEIELGEPGFVLDVPDSWTATQHPSNVKLRKPPADMHGELVPVALANSPTMNISSEVRLDHEGAVRRLLEIGGVRNGEWAFLEIAGWPALEQKYLRNRPQASGGDVAGSKKIMVLQTVVAADEVLIRMETWLTPDASKADIAEIQSIGRSLLTPTRGAPAQVAKEIEELRLGRAPQGAVPEPLPSVSAPVHRVAAPGPVSEGLVPIHTIDDFDAGYSIPVSTQGGRDSELEIAVSADGRDVVIGSNANWFFSSDAGQSWNQVTLGAGTINGNDPSVAWGQSGGAQGTFYGANIASPSTGMRTSTDGAANWTNAPAVYTCGQGGDAACPAGFPDQHHIASDRWNVTAGGDQVYSAWRHLDGNWGIVCSQDSAQTWSANARFVTGDLPKPGVGPDGMVYVIYLDGDDIRLDKYFPCEVQTNPMTRVPGFPVTIRTDVNAVACPTPGLDRCNRRNTLSGITVAVDDTDSNHVYVTYAINTATEKSPPDFFEGSPVCNDQNLCNEDIIVQDSTNGGASWPAARRVQLNSGATARRFMPWLCTIGGTAHVSWYDRRAGFPGGTTRSNNSLTDFYAGSASLNIIGDLQSDGEFQVNDLDTEDAQCEAGFATGTTGSWPANTDRPGDSEACSVQPQLGGRCSDGSGIGANGQCDYSNCGGQGVPSVGPPCECNVGATCDQSRGSPKYGDYNGNACAAGRLYMTWASAEAPLAFPDATDIDSVFSSEVVCCVPQIQIPGDVEFGEACSLGEQTETLNVCNTGKENLQVTSITSDDDQFAVTDPLTGYPVTISPDFCFPFEVTYTPDGSGNDAGTLTINNNDPINPALEVGVSGGVGVAEIDTFIADSGDFGEVCSGLFHDLNLTIQSNGTCPLEIDSVALSGTDAADFVLPDGSLAGTIIEAGNSLLVPVRFAPADFNPLSVRTASVDVESRTQGGDSLALDQTPIMGTAPPPDLNVAIADSGNFGAVCKGDFSDLDLTLFNQGRCDLTITDINSFKNDVLLPEDLQLPLVLSHDADFTLPLRYAPEECDDTPWNSSVQIISDSPGESPLAIGISGVAPCPNLVIDPGAFTGDFAFPATVVDSEETLGCYSERSTVLRNTGDCPLTITDIQATGLDFTVMQPTIFPITLPSGEETLEVTVRFTPESGGDPLAPDETTGTLTISSDDPDASGDALLCGEGVVKSGIRTLVTDVTIGFPEIVESVDSMTVKSKGKRLPNPINLMFTDVPALDATVCDNVINYHLNLETLPSTETSGQNGKSSYEVKAMDGNLASTSSFGLGQCEFKEFQTQLQSTDGGDDGICLLKDKGESCELASECCSGKCKGPNGNKTCK